MLNKILVMLIVATTFIVAEPKECKDELAKAIIISTTALETAKQNTKQGELEAELKDLEESSNILLFYYHSQYGEIDQRDVERTINNAVRKCKDVGCMLELSARHLEKMQVMKCNITAY